MAAPRSKVLLDSTVGPVAVALMRAGRSFDRRRSANFAGALMRRIGPLLKEHRLGRANLRAAFPEKSETEIERILGGVWDNLGRVGVEFVHLDEFRIEPSGAAASDALVIEPEVLERCRRVIGSGKVALGFAAHLANWELSAVVAKMLGARSAVLYRRPNIRAIGDAVVRLRAGVMGEMIPTGLDAPVRLARLLEEGVHVGMLVDQHFTRGVEVNFFGRPCKANPLIAVLARHLDCPIYGLRMIRLPDGNSFRGEITDPIEPPRDAEGRIDVAGTMQTITAVVEGWVREHPEQWLWLHRRWR
jgi:Kdo2-lipid IVA lauroyltransferase/acyltransferase